MKKMDKFIKSLVPKERLALLEILEKLQSRNFLDSDIKKLKGYDNYFRVRKGTIRIIFHLDIHGQPEIEKIERRSDTTY